MGKKLKNLTFLGEIFQIQTQTINGCSDLTRSKIFDPDPSLICWLNNFKCKNLENPFFNPLLRLEAFA